MKLDRCAADPLWCESSKLVVGFLFSRCPSQDCWFLMILSEVLLQQKQGYMGED
jgi:hypothetical protein